MRSGTERPNPLLALALALFIIVSLGWLLYVGRPIILPIVTAFFAVYVMQSISETMHRQPVLRVLPLPLLRLIILVVFSALIVGIAIMTAATIREIATVAPVYEANLDTLLEQIAARFGLDRQMLWDELRAVTIDAFDLHVMILSLLGGFTNVSAAVFLIVIYAAFLMAERSSFQKKIVAVFSERGQVEQAMEVLSTMNARVSDYLVIKTLINIALGLISFVVLAFYGVDFALFWAVMIGLLNYIPYIGSYFGVFFPVMLSVAQFASLLITLSLMVFLIAAQVVIGNYVEPRLIGRQVNLSPVVVLVALSVWGALWGIPGAILAVPMTSVMAIILGSFEGTRFIAVLLADQIDEPVRT